MAVSLDELWSDKERLRNLVRAGMALYGNDRKPRLAHEAARCLGYDSPFDALIVEMAKELHHTMVGIDFEVRAVRPVLTAYAVIPSLFTLLWKKFLLNSPVGECPRCHTLFDIDRPSKIYCSRACQGAVKQQRYRANLK